MKLIGRKEEASEMWRQLTHKSVVLSSLRRMGKTSLLKIMEANPPEGWQAVFHVVQGNTSVEEFVRRLYQKLVDEGYLDGKTNAVRDFYEKWLSGQKFGTYELPDLNRHWKEVLTAMLTELSERKALNLVILLDEFPWMIYNLATQHKAEKEAMELLDTLRAIRITSESGSGLRFVFCGSIGFHIAINHLVRQHQYLGNPTNDMHTYLLYEMSETDAFDLCRELGTILNMEDNQGLFAYIAAQVQHLPFYIDLAFKELAKKPELVSRAQVDKIIIDIVRDLSGNGHFDHFKERLEVYYGELHFKIARSILSHLSQENTPQTRTQLRQAVLLVLEADQTRIDEVIKDLTTDFYLTLDEEGLYAFRYDLLRRWWNIHYA